MFNAWKTPGRSSDWSGSVSLTYEARAYVTLVRRDSFTAAQIARTAGLPRQRIYDVLASLVEKGPPPRDPARS